LEKTIDPVPGPPAGAAESKSMPPPAAIVALPDTWIDTGADWSTDVNQLLLPMDNAEVTIPMVLLK
jgi:hypothetical protein